jgi:putative ABC transport system permease protein
VKIDWLAKLRGSDLNSDLTEEMRFHLEMRAAEYEQRGASSEEALSAARKQFGSEAAVYEDTRRSHLGDVAFALETAGRDLRFALRSLRRAPVFSVVAITTLALGIGASSAVFSMADRILFRGLPYAEGGRLVSVGVRAPIAEGAVLLGGDYAEWKQERGAFTAFTSTRGAFDCDISETNPVRVACAAVESTFLPVFGVRLAAGRNFTAADDRPKAPRVALISYALWRERYGGDRAIEGRRVNLDGETATITGVLPPDFEFPTLARVDILVPQQLDEAVERKRAAVSMVTAFGRLKPGVTTAQAKTALAPFFANFLNTISPAFRKEVRLDVVSLEDILTRNARSAAWLLLAAVLCILLIAWTNVANLWLARAASREQESRIREALGAGRGRLLMHHAAEFAVIATAGWLGGLLTAKALLAMFRIAAPPGIIGLRHASLDARIFLFSALVLALCAVAFALLPASGRARPIHGGRITGPRNLRLRSALVTAQVALSVALAASAGLFLQSLRKLERVETGARPGGAVTASVVLGKQRFRAGAQRYAFVEQLEARLNRLPGVSAVALADELPPLAAGAPFMYGTIAVDGRPQPAKGPGGMVTARHVTPDYFRALGIQLLRGRAFFRTDMNSAAGATILSDRLARQLFPQGDAVGHTIKPAGWPKTSYTVLGVAANVKNAGLLAGDAPEMYLPFDAAENSPRFVSAVVAGNPDSGLMAKLIRGEIQSLDAALPARIEPNDSRVAQLNERWRFTAALLTAFAAVGVFLTALGVYGVLAFLVSQRVREIGLRMALGATRGSIVRWILSYALRWTAAGFALGLVALFAVGRRIQSMLYGVTPYDPLTISAISVLLAVMAGIAACAPARRAAALDPAVTLRQE